MGNGQYDRVLSANLLGLNSNLGTSPVYVGYKESVTGIIIGISSIEPPPRTCALKRYGGAAGCKWDLPAAVNCCHFTAFGGSKRIDKRFFGCFLCYVLSSLANFSVKELFLFLFFQ